MAISFCGHAQVVPDTSLNQPIPDAAREKATDTARVFASDTAIRPTRPMPWEPVPKRAGLYSAIFPGMGQLYNRQYWKMPIVYAGLGVGGYIINRNLKEYRTFRRAYISRIDNDPNTNDSTLGLPGNIRVLNTADLQRIQNEYRKDLDLSILLTAVGYMIQIVDAVAAAHLRNFDISPDISMQWKPVLHSNGDVGVGLVMNFK